MLEKRIISLGKEAARMLIQLGGEKLRVGDKSGCADVVHACQYLSEEEKLAIAKELLGWERKAAAEILPQMTREGQDLLLDHIYKDGLGEGFVLPKKYWFERAKELFNERFRGARSFKITTLDEEAVRRGERLEVRACDRTGNMELRCRPPRRSLFPFGEYLLCGSMYCDDTHAYAGFIRHKRIKELTGINTKNYHDPRVLMDIFREIYDASHKHS